jgi:hypothetical protein
VYHPDDSAARDGRYGGGDFGTGKHFEDNRGAVKADAGRARQIVPQNVDDRSYVAGARLRFYKRAQAHRQAEDRPTAARAVAIVAGPTLARCTVEVPIGGLDQTPLGAGAVDTEIIHNLGAERIKRRQRAARRELKDLPGSARCPVKVSIGGLNHPCEAYAVRAIEAV